MSAKSESFTLWRGEDYLLTTLFQDAKTAYTHGYYCGMNEYDKVVWDGLKEEHGVLLLERDRYRLPHLDFKYYERKDHKTRVIFKEHMPLCQEIPEKEPKEIHGHWLEDIIDSMARIKHDNVVIYSWDSNFLNHIGNILKNLRIYHPMSSRPLYKNEINEDKSGSIIDRIILEDLKMVLQRNGIF